jgi:hypothetical protein
MVRGLILAERDQALVRLRQISLGDVVELAIDCPDCGAANQIDFALSRLPMDTPAPVETVEVGLEGGRTATLRPPNAGDQEDLLDAGDLGNAGRRTWLLARLLLRHDGRTGPFDEGYTRALSVGDRRAMEAALESSGATLDLRMSARCHACGRDFVAPFDVSSFFF